MYIPDNWIRDKKNIDEVRNIIFKVTGCFNFKGDDVLEEGKKRLKELNEFIILEELEKGTFAN